MHSWRLYWISIDRMIHVRSITVAVVVYDVSKTELGTHCVVLLYIVIARIISESIHQLRKLCIVMNLVEGSPLSAWWCLRKLCV